MERILIGDEYQRIKYPMYESNVERTTGIMQKLTRFHKWVVSQKIKKVHLLCMGSSGLFLASALRLLYLKKYEIIYIRKDNELTDSHGSPVHSSGGKISKEKNENDLFCFIDDFVSGGGHCNGV